jgi:hypothetical protein
MYQFPHQLFAAFVFSAMLSGCSTPGGGLMNTNLQSDAGAAPFTYEKVIKSELEYSLKDPASMINLLISEPLLTSCSVGIYGRFHGWRVAVSYNAKNSYGGYTGMKTYFYWFHGSALQGVSKSASYCPEAPGWNH